jgi:hypothetical protein
VCRRAGHGAGGSRRRWRWWWVGLVSGNGREKRESRRRKKGREYTRMCVSEAYGDVHYQFPYSPLKYGKLQFM